MTTIEQIRGQTTEERGTMNKPRNVLSALACMATTMTTTERS